MDTGWNSLSPTICCCYGTLSRRNAIDIVYRGTRGGTVSSMRRDAVFRYGGLDLPHAVVLMVGGNDLDKCGVPPQLVGMEIYTLARDLVSCVSIT